MLKKQICSSLRLNKVKISSLFAFSLAIPVRPPDILIKGFKLEQNKNNQKFFEMQAPEAELYKQEELAKAISPQTLIYQNNPIPIRLKANEAVADMKNYDIFFKGATEVKSPEGFLFQGRNLSYRHKEEKIYTDEAFQFESTPEFKASLIQGWATGLEADLAVKSFFLNKDVNMNILPRERNGSPSRIKGDQAKVFTEKGWAQIEGNVAYQKQNLSLRSDFLTLNFDLDGTRQGEEAIFQSTGRSSVIALFDKYKLSSKEVVLLLRDRKEVSSISALGEVDLSDNKGLSMATDKLEIINPSHADRKMKLSGNVKIRRANDEASCDEASFDPKTDYLVLKGNAVFKRGKDRMSGQEIRYSKNTGLLQVLGASGQFQKNRILPGQKSP